MKYLNALITTTATGLMAGCSLLPFEMPQPFGGNNGTDVSDLFVSDSGTPVVAEDAQQTTAAMQTAQAPESSLVVRAKLSWQNRIQRRNLRHVSDDGCA